MIMVSNLNSPQRDCSEKEARASDIMMSLVWSVRI